MASKKKRRPARRPAPPPQVPSSPEEAPASSATPAPEKQATAAPSPWLPPTEWAPQVDRHWEGPWLQFFVALLAGVIAYVLMALFTLAGRQIVQVGTWSGASIDLAGAAIAAVVAVSLYSLGMRYVARRPGLTLAGEGQMRELSAGLGIGTALIVLTYLILWLVGAAEFTVVGWNPWIISGLAVGIGSGVIEEILFRGTMVRLLDRLIGSWGALALTALVFGLAHLGNPGATVFGAVTLVLEAGVLLGAAYLLTRRLWLAIGIHVAWNGLGSCLFGGNVSGSGDTTGFLVTTLTGPDWLSGGSMGVEGSVVAAALCTGVAAFLLWRAQQMGRILPRES